MEKNYYEILEVDKKASEEIIDKAYKTLAKKYHPDLQNGEIKKEYEDKMKLINEAYSVLSNNYRRTNYDEQLQKTEILLEDYQKLLEENLMLKQEIQRLSNNIGSNKEYTEQVNKIYNEQVNKANKVYNEQVDKAVKQAYQDAYVQDLKNRGYKIKYKHTFKEYTKGFIALLGTILVFILILQIPFVKKFFVQLYEENIFIKAIVDIFRNTIKQGF